MSTVRTFNKRTRYESLVETNFDNWGKDEFKYCRLNKRKRIVTPLEQSAVKTFPPPAQNNIFALNFVVDAFVDMSTFYANSIANQNIRGLDSIKQLIPRKAYMKSIDLYLDHTEYIKNLFFQDYLLQRKSRVKTFDDVMEQFMDFARGDGNGVPILYSSFVYSTLCPIHSTGLAVEVAELSHEMNTPKYRILFDKNFDFFQNMAHQFGFVISRHAPWMFVANLDSEIMRDYAQNYDLLGATMNSILDEYFYECVNFDIDLLRKILYDSYSEFIQDNVLLKEEYKCSTGLMKTRDSLRVEESVNSINQRYNKFDWLDFYFKVRMAEKGIEVAPSRYHEFFKQCKYLYNVGNRNENRNGFDRALEYFEMKILKIRTDAYR